MACRRLSKLTMSKPWMWISSGTGRTPGGKLNRLWLPAPIHSPRSCTPTIRHASGRDSASNRWDPTPNRQSLEGAADLPLPAFGPEAQADGIAGFKRLSAAARKGHISIIVPAGEEKHAGRRFASYSQSPQCGLLFMVS